MCVQDMDVGTANDEATVDDMQTDEGDFLFWPLVCVMGWLTLDWHFKSVKYLEIYDAGIVIGNIIAFMVVIKCAFQPCYVKSWWHFYAGFVVQDYEGISWN